MQRSAQGRAQTDRRERRVLKFTSEIEVLREGRPQQRWNNYGPCQSLKRCLWQRIHSDPSGTLEITLLTNTRHFQPSGYQTQSTLFEAAALVHVSSCSLITLLCDHERENNTFSQVTIFSSSHIHVRMLLEHLVFIGPLSLFIRPYPSI